MMELLCIREMNEKYANEIVNWKYESPYDFYNLEPESITELLENEYHCVVDQRNEKVVGFFCVGKSAQVPAGSPFGAYPEGFVDIGIGMKPELTGRGMEHSFFRLFSAKSKRNHTCRFA